MNKILARVASYVLLMAPTFIEYWLFGGVAYALICAMVLGEFTYSLAGSIEKAKWHDRSATLLPEMSGVLFLACAFVCLLGDDLALFFGFVIPLMIIGVTHIFCFQLSVRVWKAGG